MQLPTRKLISNNSWAIPLSACTNLSLPPRPPERLASGFVTKGRVVLVHRCYRVRRKGENSCVVPLYVNYFKRDSENGFDLRSLRSVSRAIFEAVHLSVPPQACGVTELGFRPCPLKKGNFWSSARRLCPNCALRFLRGGRTRNSKTSQRASLARPSRQGNLQKRKAHRRLDLRGLFLSREDSPLRLSSF
jgi:hypothetical protein